MRNIAKKLCAGGLALTMALGIAPMAMAAGEFVPSDWLDEVHQSINVDSNIQLQSSGISDWEEQKTISTSSTSTVYTFNYRAVLDMSAVRTAFNNYMAVAKLLITDADTALEDIPVSGEFIIKISGLSSFTLPSDFVNGTNMYGFNNPADIYEETEARTYDADTGVLTITIKLKDTVKKSDFNGVNDATTGALRDLELVCSGLTVSGTGTYTIAGEVTGYTDIGENGQFGKVEYIAVQDPDVVPNQTLDGDKLQATLQINRRSGGGLGGGGTSSATITVYDEAGNVTDTIKKSGTATLDLTSIDTEKANALFGGWYSDKALKNPISSTTVSTTSTYSVYPKYISTGDFNVEFYVDNKKAPVNTNEASSVIVGSDSIVLGTDTITIKTDDITVKDFDAKGWFTDPECTKPFDSTAAIAKDEYPDNVIKLYTTGEAKEPILVDDDHFAYVIGYPDGTVRPLNNISREEVTTIFYRLLSDSARNAISSTSNSFEDVEADRWSNKAISTMENGKYVTGYEDGTFGPSRPITRAEFVTIASRFYDKKAQGECTFSDSIGHWAEEYITIASESQWIQGDNGNFRPNDNITRAEAMTIINRMLNRSVDEEGMLDVVENWIDNPDGAWYYYQVLEATRSHEYERADGEVNETWTGRKADRDWTKY